jgi:hypothetical protein
MEFTRAEHWHLGRNTFVRMDVFGRPIRFDWICLNKVGQSASRQTNSVALAVASDFLSALSVSSAAH